MRAPDGDARSCWRSGVGVALAVLWLVAAASAQAAPGEIWTACKAGPGAGQCSNPRGLGADPRNGHLFIGDQSNRRVVELNALGQFVKAWGWGVDTGAGELEICTDASTCQAALPAGGEAGRLSAPLGVALDSAGAVYVVDFSNRRVQKYSPDGSFRLTFGGEVNKTKVEEGTAFEAEENLCPFDPGDECKAGVQGPGKGQFGAWAVSSFIAIDLHGTASDTDDDVYVGDSGRIQRFDTDGHYQDECSVSGTVQGLAVGPDGSLLAILGAAVHKLTYGTPACADLGTYPMPKLGEAAPNATAVAVDFAGSVYVFGPTNPGLPTDPIFKFPPTPGQPPEEHFGKEQFNASSGIATNLCFESEPPGDLYVSNTSQFNAFVRAYGAEPIGCFRARTGEADPIGEASATLNGTVNPKGEAVTECRFEYGLDEEYGQEAPCVPGGAEIGTGSSPVPVSAAVGGLTKGTVYHFRLVAKVGTETETGGDASFKTLGPPVVSEAHAASAAVTQATLRALVNPEGFATTYRFDYGLTEAYGQSTEEVAVGSDRSEHTAQAVLEGLQPGQTYFWRIVAANSSGSDEESGIVRTYLPFEASSGCAGEAFRAGASAPLPDCRAYEMVSPVEKNGGDIVTGLSTLADPGGYIQSSPEGDKITYTSTASFAGEPNSFYFNQYLAERRERGTFGEGWASAGIHPPVRGKIVEDFTPGLSRDFMAFTADLCSAWLIDHQSPPPILDGQEGHANLLRRDNCEPGAGALEALFPSPPELPESTPNLYLREEAVQGISADGRHALFVARVALPHVPVAASGSETQIYDRFENSLALVSVLPGGTPSPAQNVVGSGFATGNLEGAVSENGTRVYWTAGSLGEGTIYLREHPEQGTVEDECEGENACTRKVSGALQAFFWQGSNDGTKAILTEQTFSEGEDLFEFDLGRLKAAEPPRKKLASNVLGVLGASEDLSRIYFASRQALPETGGVAGAPNVYLYEEGPAGEASYELVATVAEGDVGVPEAGVDVAYNLVRREPLRRPIRVTPDGTRLAFESRAMLTQHDNTDVVTGNPAVEVYLFDAVAGKLHCVSCNPSEARPQGAGMRKSYGLPIEGTTDVIAAAWIPTWEHPSHASNVLSEGGERLFFNAHDALVPRDTNGAQDVYQWEALGVGGCTAESSSYFPQNGGCIDLISSGESPFESEFWEASADGEDVFFTTASSLLPQDPGLVDLYDARVGGGFPQPAAVEECEGETCQGPVAPPDFDAPASSAYEGPGNVADQTRKLRCAKGKRRVRKAGRVRCVKHRGKANRNRRAAR